jgi:hypothetical protein
MKTVGHSFSKIKVILKTNFKNQLVNIELAEYARTESIFLNH